MKSKAILFQYLVLMMLKLNPDIIALKTELSEMQKRSRPCIIRFHSIQTEKPRRALLKIYTVIYALEK